MGAVDFAACPFAPHAPAQAQQAMLVTRATVDALAVGAKVASSITQFTRRVKAGDDSGTIIACFSREDRMSSQAPDPLRAEPGTERVSELLEQVQLLTAKVEGLQDGAVKESLRASLSELQAIADEMKSDSESAV
jgi:hypothetical protein